MTAQSTRPATLTVDDITYQLTWRYGSCIAELVQDGRVLPGQYATVLWPPAHTSVMAITAALGGTVEHRARVAEALLELAPS